jgi:hypothetical protein
MRSLTRRKLQRAPLAPDTARVAELIVFGPVIAGAAAIAFFGRRVLDRAGLARRPAVVTAVLAGLAAGLTWVVFVIEGALYALGENGPEYYDFSAYSEYRELTGDLIWFIPISLGYAALTTALALGAAVVWRRVHPSLGVALAAAACVAVFLPAKVPSELDRVEYGKDRVLHPLRDSDRERPYATAPTTSCFEYSVEGLYPPAPESSGPVLCLDLRSDGSRVTRVQVADELNDSGLEPYDVPDSVDLDGILLDGARWTGRQ